MTDLPATLRNWQGKATAQQAADALGVSRRTYEGWLAGRASGAVSSLLVRLIKFVAASQGIKDEPREP